MAEGLRAGCADPVVIPAGASRVEEWRLWGEDRRALAECKRRDAAKAAVIEALEGQGER